ncbi:ABC transporter substrate-binding protein [Nocardiopsis alba]|uniref:ABC transporter substrate-binding protein n=1 Tax=Nocardiopsis alba TaxID=53437 RepID=UPI0035D828C4
MRRSRALTCASLATTVALVASACGTAGGNAASTEERTVIDVWLADFPFPGYLDPFMAMAEEFEREHPEYDVNVEARDYWTLPEEVARAVAEGEAPHVANYYYGAARMARDTLTSEGEPYFVPLEEAIGGREEILGEPVVVDDLLPALRGHGTQEGVLQSMPLTTTTSVLYTNSDIMDAAGVSEPPRTWQELESACEAIAELPEGPSHCVTWTNHSWFSQQAVASQGGTLADQDNGRSGRSENVDLASEEMLDFAEWWQGLNEDGHYLHSGEQQDWQNAFDAFAGEQVAFTFNSANQFPALAGAGEGAGFAVEASPLPHNENVPLAGNPVTGDSLWVADGLEEAELDAALAFTQFLANPSNTAEWHRLGGFLPVTQEAHDLLTEEGWFEENPGLLVGTDQLAESDGSPASLGAVVGDFYGLEEQMTQAMHDVLSEGADPSERFAEATEAAQELHDTYESECVGPAPRDSACYRVNEFG